MTVEQLIQKLCRLPGEAELGYPDDVGYHGDLYFEPIPGGSPGIEGLLSFVEGNRRGAVHLARR